MHPMEHVADMIVSVPHGHLTLRQSILPSDSFLSLWDTVLAFMAGGRYRGSET